jgi:hypothetical protein
MSEDGRTLGCEGACRPVGSEEGKFYYVVERFHISRKDSVKELAITKELFATSKNVPAELEGRNEIADALPDLTVYCTGEYDAS